MKIGIMGTHGTGKSTLALKLAAELKAQFPGENVWLVPEIVRECPYPVNKDTSEIAQQWLWHMQFVRELEAQGRAEIVICDRTVLDSLAYAEFAGFITHAHDRIWDAVNWMETYDTVYFLRPDSTSPIADDGFRSTDRDFQMAIDQILARWVMEYPIKVIERIGTGTTRTLEG